MIDEIYDRMYLREKIQVQLNKLLENRSWEEIALSLYKILGNIDIDDDMCKENVDAFRNTIMKLQAKKNLYLYSSDGQVVKRIDEDRDIKFKVVNSFDKIHASKKGEVGSFIKIVDDTIGLRFDDGKEFYFWPTEVEQVAGDPIELPESKLKEQEKDWDLTFKYTHNLIEHNPLLDKTGEPFIFYRRPSGIKDMVVRVYTDYQEKWVKRNNGIPVKVNEGTVDHARRELELAGLFDKDSDYNGMLGEAVIELMEVFAKQDHSGMSAALTTELFNKLAKYQPLTELTDDINEWMEVGEDKGFGTCWQSRRNPVCFSHDIGKTYYDLDEMDREKKDFADRTMHTSKHIEL